jgi:prepilin-type processing-associated H-X9-DG protein
MVLNEKEGVAFFEAYDKFSPDVEDTNIIVPKGWGHDEGDIIYRLSSTVDRHLIADINIVFSGEEGASEIPILWDRPYVDTAIFSHRPAGGNILYMDGHVDYRLFGKVFPITETMARLLDERPREPIPYCE